MSSMEVDQQTAYHLRCELLGHHEDVSGVAHVYLTLDEHYALCIQQLLAFYSPQRTNSISVPVTSTLGRLHIHHAQPSAARVHAYCSDLTLNSVTAHHPLACATCASILGLGVPCTVALL